MAQRDFAEVVSYFDATVSSAMPEEVMAQTWDALLGQVGTFQSIDHISTISLGTYQIVTVATVFTGLTINIEITFDTEGKVAGLFFKPAETYTPPPYADPSSFTETDVVIGSAPWELPGTLTMPSGDGPFPAIVLVHGSGPNDRDETIGPNKPFRDLAWGLATEGIAVLRYEKRTAHYPAELSTMIDTLTVREEVIDDAKAAVDVLLATPDVDTANVSVLGHSLGGMLAPMIAADHAAIAGIVILAGPTRPVEDLILEQTEYLAALDGTVDADEQAQIDAIEAQVAKISALDFASDEVVLGGARSYWESLVAYSPTQTAASLSIPMLLLQGARDYQVTMVDFQGWRDALAKRSNTQFREYSGLNHLFIPGTGTPSPQEYGFHGSVSVEVVQDIVAWIRAQD